MLPPTNLTWIGFGLQEEEEELLGVHVYTHVLCWVCP